MASSAARISDAYFTAEKSRKERKEVSLKPELASLNLGQYQVREGPAAGMLFKIERQGAALVFVSPTRPPGGLRLHAENEERFFIMEADILVEFQRNRKGQVEGLTVQLSISGVDRAN